MPETGSSDDGPSERGVGPIDPDVLDRIEGYLVVTTVREGETAPIRRSDEQP